MARELNIAGIVHDPGEAPANMEGVAYGYVSKETLADLGEPSGLSQLLVVLAGDSTDESYIKGVAYRLKATVEQQGFQVSRIEIPPPGKHPHAGQMNALMFLFEAFGALSLLLSLILVVNMITGLLAQQIRQVGMMKAVGATTGQVMAIYLGGVFVLGAIATAIAIPASVLAGQAVAEFIAGMLNFDIFSNAIPVWVFVVTIGAGLLLPVLAAAYPVYRGSRVTVHQAINDYGISGNDKARHFHGLPRTHTRHLTSDAALHPQHVPPQRTPGVDTADAVRRRRAADGGTEPERFHGRYPGQCAGHTELQRYHHIRQRLPGGSYRQ